MVKFSLPGMLTLCSHAFDEQQRFQMTGGFPIIAKLGGPTNVAKILRKRGIEYKSEHYAIRQWSNRPGGIPGRVILALQDHCNESGIEYQTNDFLIPVKTKRTENGAGELGKDRA